MMTLFDKGQAAYHENRALYKGPASPRVSPFLQTILKRPAELTEFALMTKAGRRGDQKRRKKNTFLQKKKETFMTLEE